MRVLGVLPGEGALELTSQLRGCPSLHAPPNGSWAADSKKRQNDTKYTSFTKARKQTVHFGKMFPKTPGSLADLAIQHDVYCVP